MRFGSLFSGIEAASVAWGPLGWKCQWVAEIEKFPSAVLAHHYPDVPNLGDVTKVDWEKISATRPVDAIVFGSPCQSFSVAGKRLGLDDPRGNLALYALSVVDRLRPDWFVFENVPGLLSSGEGRDFGAFLGTVRDIGYQCAWRVLDAQHFGLAQRRARVFVVGHLGDWRRAAAVLFERESLRWDSPPRREAGQRIANSLTERPDRGGGNSEGQRLIAPTLPSRSKGGGGLGTDFDCDGGLIAGTLDTRNAAHMSGMKNEADFLVPEISMCLNAGGMGRQDSESETLIAHSLRAEGFDASEDGTGRGTPIVAHAFEWQRGATQNLDIHEEMSPALIKSQTPAIAFSAKDHGADAGEISPTLRSGGHDKSHANGGVMPAVAFNITPSQSNKDYNARASERAQAVTSGGNRPSARGGDVIVQSGASHEYMVESSHVGTRETDTHSALRALRETLGEKAFAEWGLGILDSLQSPEVLRSEVHGGGVRRQADETRRGLDDGPLSRSQRGSAGALREVRQAGRERRSPHRRELSEQLTRQLDSALSELSSEGAQPSAFLQDLRRASEGIGVLQQALHPVQRRPPSSLVRRLTPRECERLMGFPDDYTLVPYRGKPAADGPRYKALGNSMAVPVMSWIGRRIAMVESLSRPEAA